jgi:hypothetical protein
MKYLLNNCVFLLIVIIFDYVNANYESKHINEKEAFTPKMRELYRPYVRNARIITEGFYEKNKSDISNLFRKFGIM